MTQACVKYEVLPEPLCLKIIEMMSARTLALVACTAKCVRADVKSVCEKLVKKTRNLESLLQELDVMEKRFYEFDRFSDHAFSVAPRRGKWQLFWRGELRMREHAQDTGNMSSPQRQNKFTFCGYSPQTQIKTPLHIAENTAILDSSISLSAEVIRAIFSQGSQVQPLVISFHSKQHRASSDTKYRHDNFYGPSARWLPLFRLVEDVDLVTAPLLAANSIAAALARRDALDRPYTRGNAIISWPTFRLRYGDLLLFSHRQFRKLEPILGSRRYASFSIPDDDLDIYMGGHGTTPALILIPLIAPTSNDDFLKRCPSLHCLHWPAPNNSLHQQPHAEQ